MVLDQLTKVSKLLEKNEIRCFIPLLSQPVVVKIIQVALTKFRYKIMKEQMPFSEADLIQTITLELYKKRRELSQKVINATGILVHTNLGRAPLSQELWNEAGDIINGYSNLEFDLNSGKRGSRMGFLKELCQTYFNTESAVIVNNNAAAVHLILKTFAVNKEVIVSRGEQVQIGGGFRIPEILVESGAVLKDVGTTNITVIDDYLNAITENTSMILVVHPSNYFIEGFTQSVDLKALKKQLPPHVLLVVDQGSGNMNKAMIHEKTVQMYLESGADIVSFSGDKLLGGPQAGFIVGQEGLVNRIAKHPMMRVFRPGKETYVYFEKMLIQRLNKEKHNASDITSYDQNEVLKKAQDLCAVASSQLQIMESECFIGGGTTPKAKFKTHAIQIVSKQSAEVILENLRKSDIPIIGVIQNQSVVLYPITIQPDEVDYVKKALEKIL